MMPQYFNYNIQPIFAKTCLAQCTMSMETLFTMQCHTSKVLFYWKTFYSILVQIYWSCFQRLYIHIAQCHNGKEGDFYCSVNIMYVLNTILLTIFLETVLCHNAMTFLFINSWQLGNTISYD